VVTAAELLSVAAFDEGRHSQAFPTFGSERSGAPVTAFCRIDEAPIRSHEPIAHPDAVLVGDPTLIHQVDLFGGLGPDGYVLINSSRDFRELGLGDLEQRFRADRLLTVPASDLARQHIGRPKPNAALLGGFAALSGLISLDSLAGAIGERFGGALAEGNVTAARAAFEHVRSEVAELSHA
jgi:pyruvate ferredoxin oxidoreductase gamma subunit